MSIFFYQITYFIGILSALPLLPILWLQAKKVRASIPDLDAPTDIEGEIRGDSLQGKLRLLTLGESTVAGVGVSSHEEGLTGQMAQYLHQDTGKTIQWQVLAKSGYTAKEANELLVPQMPTESLDLIVIGLGGNDTFRLNNPWNWKRNFEALIQSVRQQQANCPIVIANMPPVGGFPAFPKLIQLFLGGLVSLHGKAILDLPKKYPNVHYYYAPIRFSDWESRTPESSDINDFFSDGVHPSALTYQLWGEQIAGNISKAGILK